MLDTILLSLLLSYSIIFQQDIRYNVHRGLDAVKSHVNKYLGRQPKENSMHLPQGVILYKPEKITKNFSDVLGLFKPKKQLLEVVDLIKNKEKYQKLGARVPQGILLQGDSGNGKTLAAHAFAKEAQLPLFVLFGSDFSHSEFVKELFYFVKTNAPCVLFIDKIDLIHPRTPTFTQFLHELDMLNQQNESNIIFLAAIDQNDLDDSLTRPGRFDLKIKFNAPDLEERKEIIINIKKTINISPEIDIDILAKRLRNFRYSTFFKIFNLAGIRAAQKNKEYIEREDFDEIIEKINNGEKTTPLTETERKIVAYHEAGHALINILMDQNIYNLYKISLIPRGKTGGITYFVSEDQAYPKTKEEIIAEIMVGFGGYAAEEIIFGSNSVGVRGDLHHLTHLLANTLLHCGMSSTIGKLSVDINDLSPETRAKFDQEIKKLAEEYYQKTKQLLLKNKDKLILLAEELLKKDFMYAEEVYKLLGIEKK